MEKNNVVAVDIAKSVFDLAGSEQPGRVSLRRRLSRGSFLGYLAQLPPSTVVMEACGSAHYWAREIEKLGHGWCCCRLTKCVLTSPATRPTAPTPRGFWRPTATPTSGLCR